MDVCWRVIMGVLENDQGCVVVLYLGISPTFPFKGWEVRSNN